jgi:hypothetical protein
VRAVASTDKSIASVAREEGISRGHASRLAHLPQSRVEIAALIDGYQAETSVLVKTALTALAESFDAEKQVVVQHSEKDGDKLSRHSEVLNLGPDHFVRLTAVKRLIELLVAGRAVPKHVAPEDSPGISLEDLTAWAEQYWQTHK